MRARRRPAREGRRSNRSSAMDRSLREKEKMREREGRRGRRKREERGEGGAALTDGSRGGAEDGGLSGCATTGGSQASSGRCYLFLAAQQVAVLGEQGSIGSTGWGGGLPNSDCASSSLPRHHPGQLSTNPTAPASDANTTRLYSNQTCEYLPECFKIDLMIHYRSAVGTNLDGNGDLMVDYDYLVLALGVTVNTFNTPGVMEHCHFLKVVEDAQKIRKSVIDCFEKASLPNLSEEEKRKILHFVIIGGGPTGVEFAVELHDFLVKDLQTTS
ncbi:unnamed protein product [Triticum turgidum subsp. durum]|uniref:FAD/NAD(P)-binding domain-containing protein n=1 Tax=Triticum turgidum subsp. durum TaxID=4567 RepID=A0A9R0SG72_TRITD|nr:unnamed protein product [Triticum turgidum subsp. durum]